MKTRSILSAALALAGTQAFAQVYGGILDGLQENPPNASPGTGVCTVTLNTTLNTMRVEVSFAGLLGTTTASHIHFGNGPGTNGAVATTTPTFTNFPLGVTSGTYDFTYDMLASSSYNPSFISGNGGNTTSAWAAFQSNLAQGKGYLNVHTNVFPGGEIRANLTPVPEPASMTVLVLGTAALIRRRVRK